MSCQNLDSTFSIASNDYFEINDILYHVAGAIYKRIGHATRFSIPYIYTLFGRVFAFVFGVMIVLPENTKKHMLILEC